MSINKLESIEKHPLIFCLPDSFSWQIESYEEYHILMRLAH